MHDPIEEWHLENARRAAVLNFVMEAHAKQVDKIGVSYITGHLIPVAVSVPAHLFVTALAHDVLEDTDKTEDDLRASGHFDEREIQMIVALTKTDDQSYSSYLRSLRHHHDATTVKLADLRNNTDPERMAHLTPETRKRLRKKYKKALAILHFLEGDE